jgi:hypothetical protein
MDEACDGGGLMIWDVIEPTPFAKNEGDEVGTF